MEHLGGAACSSACALLPPNPKELTPATALGVAAAAGGEARRWRGVLCTGRASPSGRRRGATWGLRAFRCALGNVLACRSASAVLSTPAIPAAPSRWPTQALMAPIITGHERCGERSTSAACNAAASIGSPSAVPVPVGRWRCGERLHAMQAISGHQRTVCFEQRDLGRHQWQSVAIRGNPWPSAYRVLRATRPQPPSRRRQPMRE